MPNNETPVLEVARLSKMFHNSDGLRIDVLSDISLLVYPGEIVSIIGKSGVGKSTLLNLIAGLIAPTTGEIKVFGKTPTCARSQMSYFQQRPQLLPYRTTFQNSCLGLELRHELSDKTILRINELLDLLHLTDYSSYYPDELSGGMQQRVVFARTFSVAAPLLLCDEPLASLDFETRIELESLFWKLVKRENRAGLFVTHDIESAIAVSDRILVLSGRPATVTNVINIEQTFSREDPELCRQSPMFSAYFTKLWNALRGKLETHD